MPRTYGTTNAAPYASAPAVGAAGDTYYNTTDKGLYQSDGIAWSKVGPAGTDLWKTTGLTLTPVDVLDAIAIPGPTAAAADQSQLILGSRTPKLHVEALAGLDYGAVGMNAYYNGTTWKQDDATKGSWFFYQDISATPITGFQWIPAAGVNQSLLTLDTAGTLALKNASATIRGGLNMNNAGSCSLITNGGNATPDDTTKSSWMVIADAVQDKIVFARRLPNAAAGVTQFPFQVDSGGVLTTTSNVNVGGTGIIIANASAVNCKGSLSCFASGSNFPYVDLVANTSQGIATRPVWLFRLNTDSDQAELWRQAASGGAWASAFQWNNVGDFIAARFLYHKSASGGCYRTAAQSLNTGTTVVTAGWTGLWWDTGWGIANAANYWLVAPRQGVYAISCRGNLDVNGGSGAAYNLEIDNGSSGASWSNIGSEISALSGTFTVTQCWPLGTNWRVRCTLTNATGATRNFSGIYFNMTYLGDY